MSRAPGVPGAGADAARRVKLSVRNVTKRFGQVVANDHIDLSVYAGEFITLLGPSGCGKTTLLRIVAGLEACDEGGVWIDGRDVTLEPPRRRHLGMVFQQHSLFPHMTVWENVAYGLKVQGRPGAEISATVAGMLALVRLADIGSRYPSQLSGGQQQRVALARALATSPSLLMLDEPLGALDLKLRRQMRLELKRIHRETGVTFLHVTHDQEEALHMSDRIAVLHNGRVEQVADPWTIYARPSTAFVADFVGDVVLLECEPIAGDRGRALVAGENSGAGVEISGDTPGEPFLLVVRPEHVRVRPAGAREEGALPGRIVEIIHEGSTTLYELALQGGQRLKARLMGAPEQALAVNAEVRVEIRGAGTCLPRL